MPGGIRVDLEVVDGFDVLCRLQHFRTQRHDTIMGDREVLDPQVEVDLLAASHRASRAGRGWAPAEPRLAVHLRRSPCASHPRYRRCRRAPPAQKLLSAARSAASNTTT